MVIDIDLLRPARGGDISIVRESERKRFRDPAQTVDPVVLLDEQWRKDNFNLEQAQKKLNEISKEIGNMKKKNSNCDVSELKKQATEEHDVIKSCQEKASQSDCQRHLLLSKIGNILSSKVFESNNEENNVVLRSWKCVETHIKDINSRFLSLPNNAAAASDKSFLGLTHADILRKLSGVNTKAAIDIAGHRSYFLTGVGMILNNAILQYGLSFLIKKQYKPVQPPFFMRHEVLKETAELADFEDTLYKIPSKNKGEDMFLIATSEQPISALHRGEVLTREQLPIRYAGSSTCFRREAGAHGKDVTGIFRVHQFEKIEQFLLTEPERSDEALEELISTSEEFYQTLGLPYRIVQIVSGALNNAAKMKYDLEAYFPGYGAYRELVSCSNCTDYQSRDLNIKLGHSNAHDGKREYVHLLNGTLAASQRTMCCILENYQTPDGVRVPPALLPYTYGIDFLPFTV